MSMTTALARRRSRNPEVVARREGARLRAGGGATRAAGTSAVREFDATNYLGADALQSVFDESTVTNFMPQLRRLQARNARRGVRGNLAGATEGDLASSFHRNLMARVAAAGGERARLDLGRAGRLADIGGEDRAQGLSLLGTELELKMARDEAKRNRKRGIWGTLGAGAGAAVGGLMGNPALGARIGSRIGGALG